MKKVNKILCPTDFSESSANAFQHAIRLADQMEAEIEVLHVVYPQTEGIDIPVMTSQVTMERVAIAKELLDTFIQNGKSATAQHTTNDISFSQQVEIGTAVKTVTQIAKRDGANLIVLGSRGENKTRLEKLMGSVAAGVVKNAHCPVIVVPEQSVFKPYNSIAYATDVMDADPFEIWKVSKLLTPFHAVMHCVHFNAKHEDQEKTSEKLQDIKEFFAEQSPALQMKFHNLPGENLEHSLNEFVDTYDIDLLVMYQPHQSFWDRLFFRSATKEMAMHTHVPLLVQKETD